MKTMFLVLSFLSVGTAFANETDTKPNIQPKQNQETVSINKKETTGPLVCSTVVVTTGNDEVSVTVECTKCSINASEAFSAAFGCAYKKLAIAATTIIYSN